MYMYVIMYIHTNIYILVHTVSVDEMPSGPLDNLPWHCQPGSYMALAESVLDHCLMYIACGARN